MRTRPGLLHLGLLIVTLMSTTAARVRLFDAQGEIHTVGGRTESISDRLVDDLHTSLGPKRSVYFRGLTLAPGEEIRFQLGRSGALRTLRWIEVPQSGTVAESSMQVLVDGRVAPPLPAGEPWRKVDIPTSARNVRFRASKKRAVRFGEPVITRKSGSIDRPDLLLITVDTLRGDAMLLGGGEETMPGVVWFARDAVTFQNAIAPASWTLPTFAGMFTGRHPEVLGAVRRSSGIPEAVPTLAEALAAAGYRTHAITQNVMLSPDGGFARGFDSYDHYMSSDEDWRSASRVTDLAFEWMNEAPTSPTFLWLHYFDPHSLYAPLPEDARRFDPAAGAEGERFEVPDPGDTESLAALRSSPERLKRVRALYQGEVYRVDRQITRLLDVWGRAGRLDRTVVAITSDHGEEFLEHGFLGHGHSVFEEAIRVPLVVRGAGLHPTGRLIDEQVTLLDLAPTLAEIAGAEFPLPQEPFVGRSLVRAIRGQTLKARSELAIAKLFPEHDGAGYAIRDGRYKWTFSGDPNWKSVFVYDLQLDPDEKSPKQETNREALRRVREAWAAVRKATHAGTEDPEAAEKMRALGYID